MNGNNVRTLHCGIELSYRCITEAVQEKLATCSVLESDKILSQSEATRMRTMRHFSFDGKQPVGTHLESTPIAAMQDECIT